MNKSVNPKTILMLAATLLILSGVLNPAIAGATEHGLQPGNEQLGKITSFLKVMEKYRRFQKKSISDFIQFLRDKEYDNPVIKK